MKKILTISILTVILSISIISVSAQNQYDIPSWVKGVAGFWADGKISDADFGEGLAFLIDNEIIQVPKIQELQDQVNQLQSENAVLRSQLNLPKSDDIGQEDCEPNEVWQNNECVDTIDSQTNQNNCDPSYPDFCIPPYPPDLDCGEISYSNFRVLSPDPHGFDRDNDGIGCES